MLLFPFAHLFVHLFSLSQTTVIQKPRGSGKLGAKLSLAIRRVKAKPKSLSQKHRAMLDSAYEKVN